MLSLLTCKVTIALATRRRRRKYLGRFLIFIYDDVMVVLSCPLPRLSTSCIAPFILLWAVGSKVTYGINRDQGRAIHVSRAP